MKSLKVAMGLGAACVACCAIPVSAGVAGLAALSAALVAWADVLVPAAWAAAALALLGGSVWVWRRASRQTTGCACPTANGISQQPGCNTQACDAVR
jgi:hypothetical protein